VSTDVPWKRIMVESTAVIASILLAFGIDATWDAWRERATELEIMDALYHEMLGNRAELTRVIRLNAEAAEHFNTFLRLSPAELASTTGDRLALDALWAHYTFDPEIGALALFLQRDVSGSESGRLVRRSAVNWQALLVDAGEEGRVLWTFAGKTLGLLAAYSADQVPEGGREPNLYTILDDYGPRMARLRTDDEFLTAARAKFTLQQVYRDELSFLLDQTEKLLEILAPPGR
jgi:hypothetical protein